VEALSWTVFDGGLIVCKAAEVCFLPNIGPRGRPANFAAREKSGAGNNGTLQRRLVVKMNHLSDVRHANLFWRRGSVEFRVVHYRDQPGAVRLFRHHPVHKAFPKGTGHPHRATWLQSFPSPHQPRPSEIGDPFFLETGPLFHGCHRASIHHSL
jgi:hypothetical protein